MATHDPEGGGGGRGERGGRREGDKERWLTCCPCLSQQEALTRLGWSASGHWEGSHLVLQHLVGGKQHSSE